MAFVHQRACGPFSPSEHKKGNRKVSKADALPKWDPALAVPAFALASGMLRKGAWPRELAAGGLMWLCRYSRATSV